MTQSFVKLVADNQMYDSDKEIDASLLWENRIVYNLAALCISLG